MAKLIPTKLYKKIVELVPILCVDVILEHEGKYILVKRKNNPLKGQWWIIGGRALKGERLLSCAKRKVREETGLVAHGLQISGIYEDSYRTSAFGVPTSSVSILFTGKVDTFKPKLDSTSSDIRLSEKLPERFMKRLCL